MLNILRIKKEDIRNRFILEGCQQERKEIIKKLKQYLDNGKFNQICSNETTLLTYLKNI